MRTFYWIGGTGNWNDGTHWSASSGGVALGSYPNYTDYDNVYFDANSFSASGQKVTFNVDQDGLIWHYNIMDWSAALFQPEFHLNASCTFTVNNLIFCADMTLTWDWANWPTFNLVGDEVLHIGIYTMQEAGIIDTKGIPLPNTWLCYVNNYDISLASDLVCDGQIMFGYSANYLITNNYDITCKAWYGWTYGAGMLDGDFGKIKPGESKITLTGYDTSGTYQGNVWSPNFVRVYDADGNSDGQFAEIALTDNTANTKTILQGGTIDYYEFDNLTITGGGAGDILVGAQDIRNIDVTYFSGTLRFYTSNDQFNIESFIVRGTDVTHIQNINRESGSSTYVDMALAMGSVNVSWCNIQNIHVSGLWYACNCIDGGGNDGWIWACSPDLLTDIPYELQGEPMEAGVYTLGRHSIAYPVVLDFTYPISERQDGEFALRGVEIGSILVDGNDVYVSWKKHDYVEMFYGIDKIDSSNKLDGAYFETRVLSGNREQFGNFSKMVMSYAELPTGTNITLQYSKDYGTTWVTMTTKKDTDRKLLYCEEEFEASSVAYRAVITATGNDAPAIERADIVMR